MESIFNKSGITTKATKNSGAAKIDGDFSAFIFGDDNVFLRCEGKHRNTEGWSINKDHWVRHTDKCLKHGGIPALIVENKDNQSFINLRLEDFVQIIADLRGTHEKRN